MTRVGRIIVACWGVESRPPNAGRIRKQPLDNFSYWHYVTAILTGLIPREIIEAPIDGAKKLFIYIYLIVHLSIAVVATALYVWPREMGANQRAIKVVATSLLICGYLFGIVFCFSDELEKFKRVAPSPVFIALDVISVIFLCPVSNLAVLYVTIKNVLAWRNGRSFVPALTFGLVVWFNVSCIMFFDYVLDQDAFNM